LPEKGETMSGMFEIKVKTQFAAAHSLKGYQGDCAGIHGHNWNVEVFIRCRKLDEIGIGIDFRDVKKTVGDVIEGLDHCNLNDFFAFRETNPTSENIARFLYYEIGKKLNSDNVEVSKVMVSETSNTGASYWEE
jgi:6-pyruvoyltetrahydropterin/6-carboxytetrahydropterin synthase